MKDATIKKMSYEKLVDANKKIIAKTDAANYELGRNYSHMATLINPKTKKCYTMQEIADDCDTSKSSVVKKCNSFRLIEILDFMDYFEEHMDEFNAQKLALLSAKDKVTKEYLHIDFINEHGLLSLLAYSYNNLHDVLNPEKSDDNDAGNSKDAENSTDETSTDDTETTTDEIKIDYVTITKDGKNYKMPSDIFYKYAVEITE